MDCNPYLGIAISLACGYLGIKNEIRPSKQFRGDAYEGAEDIPRGLGSALDLFEEATHYIKFLVRILSSLFDREKGRARRIFTSYKSLGKGASFVKCMNLLYVNDETNRYPHNSWYTATSELLPDFEPLTHEISVDVAIIGGGMPD